jgi:hypothetical protein
MFAGYLQHSHRGWWKLLTWVPLHLAVCPRAEFWRHPDDRTSRKDRWKRNIRKMGESVTGLRLSRVRAPQQRSIETPRTLNGNSDASTKLNGDSKSDPTIEVHWTVRMLADRPNTKPGNLPGYKAQERRCGEEPLT